jgi:hypothetical protein
LGFYVNGSRVGGFDTSGNLTANGQFNGAGTGLTGTAASLSIGGNAATATNATNATNATYSTTQSAGTNNTTIATTAFATSVANGLFSAVHNPSRALNTTYTNSTGKPMFVVVYASTGGANSLTFYINGGAVSAWGEGNGYVGTYHISAIVPAGATYEVGSSGGSLANWTEIY